MSNHSGSGSGSVPRSETLQEQEKKLKVSPPTRVQPRSAVGCFRLIDLHHNCADHL